MNPLKKEIFDMVDALPEEKIVLVKRFLEDLINNANDEDKLWLDADLGELPPYNWGKKGPPKGKAVQYQPGVGLVVKEVER